MFPRAHLRLLQIGLPLTVIPLPPRARMIAHGEAMDNFESKQIFGTDIDIPSTGMHAVDIKEKIIFLSKILGEHPDATLEATFLGELELKPAYRIRLKGIYSTK